MNSITLTGNITKDCELRAMSSGDSVASFSVADNQGKDKPAIFWNCSLFGKRADALSQYLVRGQAITVVGNVSEREFTDKDGLKRKVLDVRVSDVALQGGSKQGAAPAPAARQQSKPAAQQTADEFADSDIPF
jgi:single-strand DNA-binding protein